MRVCETLAQVHTRYLIYFFLKKENNQKKNKGKKEQGTKEE
jgi:hypothetical protein